MQALSIYSPHLSCDFAGFQQGSKTFNSFPLSSGPKRPQKSSPKRLFFFRKKDRQPSFDFSDLFLTVEALNLLFFVHWWISPFGLMCEILLFSHVPASQDWKLFGTFNLGPLDSGFTPEPAFGTQVWKSRLDQRPIRQSGREARSPITWPPPFMSPPS